MRHARLSCWLLASLPVLLSGCGGAEVHTITGTVLLDGKPLAPLSVTFTPKEDLHLGMMGVLANRDDGTFEINPDPERGEGRPGTYVVSFVEARVQHLLAPRFPAKYGDETTSPLEVEITKGNNHLAPFQMASDSLPRLR